jgi:glycosyltransferase involved in cell wall biosynthesis
VSLSPIRVLTFLESSTVTGPAKNVIEFAVRARDSAEGEPPILLEAAAWVRDGAGESNVYVQALESAKIPVHILREKHLGDPGALRRLGELIDRVRPDVVQTHNCKSHLFVRLSERWRRTAWVAFHHGYTATSVKTLLYNQFDRFSLLRATKMVTVCRPFFQEISALGVDPAKITVVHNSVKTFVPPEAEAVHEVSRRYGIQPGRPSVLSVGRLSREKAHRDLIEAFAILRKREPSLDPQLVFVGDGHEAEALRRQSGDRGLSDSVVFCGQQADVRPFYALASVFSLPSLSEGSPNALLEAMAAGVPAVATQVGGVPEIAENRRNALLVPPANRQALADALRTLLIDRPLARSLADAAIQDASERFSPEAQTAALRKVYVSAVAAR